MLGLGTADFQGTILYPLSNSVLKACWEQIALERSTKTVLFCPGGLRGTKIAGIFDRLSVWDNFEEGLLQETSRFFQEWSAQQLERQSAMSYIAQAEACFVFEKKQIQPLLKPETNNKIYTRVDKDT